MSYQLFSTPVARPADTRQTLDVEVNRVAGSLVFVANHRGEDRADATVQSGPAQDAVHRSSTQLQFAGDTPAAAALPLRCAYTEGRDSLRSP
jgi:hypothetical protein